MAFKRLVGSVVIIGCDDDEVSNGAGWPTLYAFSQTQKSVNVNTCAALPLFLRRWYVILPINLSTRYSFSTSS